MLQNLQHNYRNSHKTNKFSQFYFKCLTNVNIYIYKCINVYYFSICSTVHYISLRNSIYSEIFYKKMKISEIQKQKIF